jgi:phage gp36-like protein
VVEDGLRDASDEIDAYVAVRHTLPLNPVHPVLKPLCIDIALYKMSTGPTVTEEKRKRYEDARALLKMIAEGKISLGQQAAAANSGGAFFQSNPRLFGRGMEG